MADDLNYTPATDALKALTRFIHEPEPGEISGEQVRAQLKKAGFDANRVKKDFRQDLEKAKGRARLAEARAKRTPLLARFAELRSQLPSVTDVKAAARQIFNDVFGGTPQAEMYCRQFEKLSDEDARSMIEDASLLDAFEKDEPDAKT